MGTALRRVISLAGLGVLMLLALGYRHLPELSPATTRTDAGRTAALEFHRYDRAVVQGLEEDAGPCGSCHPAAAHQRDGVQRSFLNLHRRSLDCGVCHLRGAGVVVRHFRGDQPVTDETLAEGPYGRVYAALRVGDGWRPVRAPEAGVSLRAAGPGCRDCHRRGSPVLATRGLLDGYRRRVLEDLSVLRFLGRSP